MANIQDVKLVAVGDEAVGYELLIFFRSSK
jgi:hypothetical protein